MPSIRRAMLFAAGLGTRLRPLTEHTPKSLVCVGQKPLLDYALDSFEQHGCERVVVNTHYLGERVREHLAAQRRPFELQLSQEDVLLETGGGIVKALPWLGDQPFFSANSDVVLIDGHTSSLSRLEAAYDPARMDALLLLCPRERCIGYSGPNNFDLGADGVLVRSDRPRHVFTGLQILHPRLFAGRSATPFSLRELYQAAEARGRERQLSRMYGLLHDGQFVHVGTPAELIEAEAFFASRSKA